MNLDLCPICRRPLSTINNTDSFQCPQCRRHFEGDDRTVDYFDPEFSPDIGRLRWNEKSIVLKSKSRNKLLKPTYLLIGLFGFWRYLVLPDDLPTDSSSDPGLLAIIHQFWLSIESDILFELLLTWCVLLILWVWYLGLFDRSQSLSVTRNQVVLVETSSKHFRRIRERQVWSVDEIRHFFVNSNLNERLEGKGERRHTYSFGFLHENGEVVELLFWSFTSKGRISPLDYNELEDSALRLKRLVEEHLGLEPYMNTESGTHLHT